MFGSNGMFLLYFYALVCTNCFRARDGKDWKTVATNLGVGEIGGSYAKEDDGNPVWEDIEYESDFEYEYEARWKADEKANGMVFKSGREEPLALEDAIEENKAMTIHVSFGD